MAKTFKAKIRKIGSSFGILVPIDVIREEGISEGEEIEAGVLKKNKELIEESFGIAKGASKFEREHSDRSSR